MPSLRTSRTALVHAVLTLIHPSIAHDTHFPFPVPLPSELHLLIRAHLRVHIARALLDSLHASLSSALSTLCDDCKSYYAHVFGPHVADWPVIRASRGCRCTAIGLPSTPPWRTVRANNTCLETDLSLRPPVGDKEPPAYFLAHIQQTLAAYASMDPSFPYADKPISTNADLDALVLRVLSTFGWTAIPTSHRNWEFDNDVSIIPLSASPLGGIPITLNSLQLRLDLAVHDDILAHSMLHPTKVTYFPPLPCPTSTGMSYTPICVLVSDSRDVHSCTLLFQPSLHEPCIGSCVPHSHLPPGNPICSTRLRMHIEDSGFDASCTDSSYPLVLPL